MAFIPDGAVYSSGEVSGQAFKLYACLCAHRNKKNGQAWPDRETIHKETGINVSYISTLKTELNKAGWIAVESGKARLLKGFDNPTQASEIPTEEFDNPTAELENPTPIKGIYEPVNEPAHEPDHACKPDLTESEKQALDSLKAAKSYPFDYEKDLAQMRKLTLEFPIVNVPAEILKLSDWAADARKPIKRGRLFMRNWIEKASRAIEKAELNGGTRNGTTDKRNGVAERDSRAADAKIKSPAGVEPDPGAVIKPPGTWYNAEVLGRAAS